MNSRSAAAKLTTVLLAAGVTAATVLTVRADSKRVPMVAIHSEVQVAASPAMVWAFLTTGKYFATWCPNWRAAKNTKVNLARVGDVLAYADAWGNGGRSIVTYCVANRELRVANEPDKGDYVRQVRIQLNAAAGGTHVDFWDQYSDASAESSLVVTMAKMQGLTDAEVAALKQGVEHPPVVVSTPTVGKK